MSENAAAGILLLVRFRSSLPEEEVVRRYQARLSEFRALPGLLQKYSVHDPATGEWGGFYHWESREALEAYLDSDLRRSIPATYGIVGEPRVERVEVVEVLRP